VFILRARFQKQKNPVFFFARQNSIQDQLALLDLNLIAQQVINTFFQALRQVSLRVEAH